MNLSLNRIKSQNLMTNIYIGSALLILSILDVFLNSFFIKKTFISITLRVNKT